MARGRRSPRRRAMSVLFYTQEKDTVKEACEVWAQKETENIDWPRVG